MDLIISGPGTLERTDYNFVGWNTAADGSGTFYAAGATYAENASLTLYAQWSQSGVLAVTGGNLESTGTFGGPFNPSTLEYTLENTGSEPVNWTVAKTADWVSLSATSGTLESESTTTITVSINAAADGLVPDAYLETLTFTNLTNGLGDTTRSVGLTVAAVPVEVTLGALAQTYDGSPKPITVTTDPTPIAYSVTYDGEPGVPVDSGSYAVVVTITEPNHAGSASDTLVIGKATQTISFAPLDSVEADVGSFELTATASSGLPISYNSSTPSVATVSGNLLTVVGVGEAIITASQDGNMNFEAAAPVEQLLTVLPADLAGALIYEPFGQPLGSLAGTATGAGLSGNWTINQAFNVVDPFDNYGALGNQGNRVDIPSNPGAWAQATTTSVLADNGLLEDGATLWFSYVFQKTAGGGSNEHAGFAFGTSGVRPASNGLNMANSGSGLGVYSRDLGLTASSWTGGTRAGGGTVNLNAYSSPALVIGKIEWGADGTTDDILTLWTRSLDDIETAPTAGGAVRNAGALNQSAFNTISFGQRNSGGTQTYDEIRFGSTYWDVIGQGGVISSPVDSFAITGIPTSITVGSEITGITITALDEDDQIATSFTGTVTYGGTAGITGTSANFVNGVLENVSITPMISGVDLTFTVDDGGGQTGSTTFSVIGMPYNDWANAAGLTGADGDPAAILQPDGLTNLQKFAFGMDPTVSSRSATALGGNGEVTPGMPIILNIGSTVPPVDFQAVFSRRKNHQAAGLIYVVEFSAGLDIWVPSGSIPTVISDPEAPGDIEAVGVPYPLTIPTNEGDKKPQFFRVGVSLD